MAYASSRLDDLTLKHNFMFTAVMLDPENCKHLLELVLGIEIARVEVDREKSIINHPEYHSIRMDIYAKDEYNTRYNIEMQVATDNLEKRTRYYHSQMDLDILSKGVPYRDLPNTYVIFLCNFDPFKKGRFVYTVQKSFKECADLAFDDGSYIIFLSTEGTNKEDISEELYSFLMFLRRDLDSLMDESSDEYIQRLQRTIAEIKRHPDWRHRYMLLQELIEIEKKKARDEALEEGREEGRAEGRAEGREEGRAEGREYFRDFVLRTAIGNRLDEEVIAQIKQCDDFVELERIFHRCCEK